MCVGFIGLVSFGVDCVVYCFDQIFVDGKVEVGVCLLMIIFGYVVEYVEDMGLIFGWDVGIMVGDRKFDVDFL